MTLAVLFEHFVFFKWKYIFVTEQSKYGLFVVLWTNNKPALKQYTVESRGGGKDGEVSSALSAAGERGKLGRPVFIFLFALMYSAWPVPPPPYQKWTSPVKHEQLSWTVSASIRWKEMAGAGVEVLGAVAGRLRVPGLGWWLLTLSAWPGDLVSWESWGQAFFPDTTIPG